MTVSRQFVCGFHESDDRKSSENQGRLRAALSSLSDGPDFDSSWLVRHGARAIFANRAKRLPEVEYPPFDPTDTLRLLDEAREQFVFSPLINRWLFNIADNLETGARLISATGTPEFFEYSRKLYGAPKDGLTDEENTTLDLAIQFDGLFEEFEDLDLGAPPAACISATTVADAMRDAVQSMFGNEAPDVMVVDELSANALAGPRRIRIRASACFTDKDIQQLIHHESHIHVATSLNGLAQRDLRILAASHPGTTRTQEGLAVFAEFITGAMDLDRFRRLADRVIATQLAIEGADFIDVYEYFLDRTGMPEQAFENARRVFRGGVLTGGAPFTKDIVYLDGLLRVHNFLRTAVASGRADCLRLLFCGKLDLEDLPVIGHFSKSGLCLAPSYLPPWASDIRFLLCYLTYSSFLNRIDLGQVKLNYASMLEKIPSQI